MLQWLAISEPARLHYGAIGDVLNTASRLEGLNKVIGTRIVVSAQTARLCSRHWFQPIGSFVLRGKAVAMDVVTPWQYLAGSGNDYAGRYAAAYEALKNGAPDAGAQWRALRRERPDDPCVAFHYARLARGETGVVIDLGR